MFIDTHCHLNELPNLDEVIKRAADANVGVLIAASAHPDDFAKNIDISAKYKNVFCTLGIYPEYAKDFYNKDLIFDAENPRVVGIGEIGLDYHYGDADKLVQIELFQKQLGIAQAAKLPVAIHARDADADIAENLKNWNGGGVMHCYTSSWDLATKMLDRGFYFSASGILTFKNADDVREIFRRLPHDRIVIETDSPLCAPIPYRGKPCEPFMSVNTASVLADVRGIPLPELENQLFENTLRLYPKIKI